MNVLIYGASSVIAIVMAKIISDTGHVTVTTNKKIIDATRATPCCLLRWALGLIWLNLV